MWLLLHTNKKSYTVVQLRNYYVIYLTLSNVLRLKSWSLSVMYCA